MKGYIYKYTFSDGKVYIGQTRRPIELRHAEHLKPSTGPLNPGFWRAYQRLGMPTLTVLETVEDDDMTRLVDTLARLENIYIAREHATDPDYGYNRRQFATTYSPDINILNKEFNRLCQQAEEEKQPFFETLAQKWYNKKDPLFTEEEQAFIKHYIETDNIFYHPADKTENVEEEDEDEGEEFDYIEDEALEFAIFMYNEHMREMIGQYISENAEEIISKAKEGKIIQQLDQEGTVIREFKNWDDIRAAFNIIRIDNILNVIKGRQKTAYGFFWRYKPVSMNHTSIAPETKN